jgi:hypothetical protein
VPAVGPSGGGGERRRLCDAAPVAKREGTVILAHPDAGMNVEARVGPLEHPLGDAWR